MSPFRGEQRERVRHPREGQHRVDVVLADRARRHAGISRLRRILREGYPAGLPDRDQAATPSRPPPDSSTPTTLGPKACAADSNRGSTAVSCDVAWVRRPAGSELAPCVGSHAGSLMRHAGGGGGRTPI
jgi:hypothetical protein